MPQLIEGRLQNSPLYILSTASRWSSGEPAEAGRIHHTAFTVMGDRSPVPSPPVNATSGWTRDELRGGAMGDFYGLRVTRPSGYFRIRRDSGPTSVLIG